MRAPSCSTRRSGGETVSTSTPLRRGARSRPPGSASGAEPPLRAASTNSPGAASTSLRAADTAPSSLPCLGPITGRLGLIGSSTARVARDEARAPSRSARRGSDPRAARAPRARPPRAPRRRSPAAGALDARPRCAPRGRADDHALPTSMSADRARRSRARRPPASREVHALRRAAGSTERTRFWYISSATNGVNGASSLATVTRQLVERVVGGQLVGVARRSSRSGGGCGARTSCDRSSTKACDRARRPRGVVVVEVGA